MFWLFKIRINFSQDNSIANEIMSKLLMANLLKMCMQVVFFPESPAD